MPDDQRMTKDDVRALYGAASPMVYAKQLPQLDKHARAFIALSPFMVLASADAGGRCDATPRGDGPGFVTVLEDGRLAIPDRLGNRRVDTLMNVAENPHVGMLFLVPGISESLRVNGTAVLSTDPAILEPMAVGGKVPTSALVVTVEEVFFHCGKAVIRSELWNPERQIPKSGFPSLGRILADQVNQGQGAEETDKLMAEAYKKRLY